MAYHGYIPQMKKFLSEIERPKILEIGVDRGVTFLSLATWLVRCKKHFFLTGVDILVQETASIQLANLDRIEMQVINLLQENSLDYLRRASESSENYDLILLDGDHNYETVTKELAFIEKMMHKSSVLIVDDYNGKWATRDLYYSTRPGYENIFGMLKPSNSEDSTKKMGVKTAVDDWFDSNKFHMQQFMLGEPVVITRV